MADVVIVVDMLRGFLEEGRALDCGPTARAIVPNVRRLLEAERLRGSHLIFLADTHDPDDKEFAVFPPHCVRGTEETEVTPELAGLATEIIPKRRYSGFFGTNLDARLRELAPSMFTVCGICTDICVMHTVADARNRDYPVVVPVDCVATFDEEAHRCALQHMERVLGAKLVRAASESG